MNPDVASAIEYLRRKGELSEAQAALALRAARGPIVSLRAELMVLLYAGVLLVTAGAGLLVKENLGAIGPLGVALALAIAACLSLAWVVRTSPPFSWNEVPSPNLAFDYLLLLGLLLAASDLAYIEYHFTPLGAAWPWHLLIVSFIAGALAVRYDSRVALSLCLSSFAACRGVSVSFLEWTWWRAPGEALRVNMIVCGMIFILLGAVFTKTRLKSHFEPVATHLGWLLVLGSLLMGAFETEVSTALVHGGILLLLAVVLAWWTLRSRRLPLFVMGVVGAYAGLSALVLRGLDLQSDTFNFSWFAVSSLVLLVALVAGHRAMRGKP